MCLLSSRSRLVSVVKPINGLDSRRSFQGFSYGPLVWASNLDPNVDKLYTIYKTGAHRTDPTRIKGAHEKAPQKNPQVEGHLVLGVCGLPEIIGLGRTPNVVPLGRVPRYSPSIAP